VIDDGLLINAAQLDRARMSKGTDEDVICIKLKDLEESNGF
jgi:hypothetical protein